MFNKKMLEKITCILSAAFIVGLFHIYNTDLSRSEALIILLFLFLIISRHTKKRELKSLSVKYETNQKLLSEIFKHCPDLIFYKDCDYIYVSCNQAATKALSQEIKDIAGKNDFDIFPEETAKMIREKDKQIIKNKESINYDLERTLKNGETKIFNIIKTPLFDKNNQVCGILGIGRDVTIERILKTALEEKEIQLSAMLNNMPFMAWLKDKNSKYLIVNKTFAKMCSDNIQNTIGKHDFEYFPAEHAELYVSQDNMVMQSKQPLRIEEPIAGPDGIKWHETFKSPVFDDKGNVIGTVGIARDITEKKEIEAQKETFVATLTHDLKVPTVAQIKALELILNGSLGDIKEEQKDVLSQILNSCRYMLNMISTLLSTYRYEDGVKKINYEEFNFAKLVSECCNEISFLAKEKEQTLSIKNNLSKFLVCADKLEIKRVITNLLSNAISYSLNNSEIDISMEENDLQIICLVTSHSKIIPQEELDKLFDKYVTKAESYKQLGTGLGLYLTKQIITAHKGEIVAQSDEINGNTFGFKIPKTTLKNIIEEELEKSQNLQF